MTVPRNGKDNTAMVSALKWLPLAILALISAIAWGAQQATTIDHERRITGNEKLLRDLMTGQARIEERTQRTGADVKENKTLLLQMLRALKNGKEDR
ncbi:MAG: hypothetical protein V3U60_16425 [Gammaproteobacteria bacterium]